MNTQPKDFRQNRAPQLALQSLKENRSSSNKKFLQNVTHLNIQYQMKMTPDTSEILRGAFLSPQNIYKPILFNKLCHFYSDNKLGNNAQKTYLI